MYRSKPKIQPPLYSDLPPTGPEIARAKSLMQDSRTVGTGLALNPVRTGLAGLVRVLRTRTGVYRPPLI